ncbi:hypothetical protein A165_14270 [Vibrio tasmaniensis ZS-17]|uniref:hypothetical protein n=1 Tax=Vibrio tasmaniensis TaxID=212663 RepID=UPI0003129110|nr:hypothetical protein [Vibrio tasmaniensis]OED62718.1 hypothetical protein A165_14270 [Vibrio tasmaniensis ZS-17]
MKKTLLFVPLLCVSTGVLAKVTYEDALESARPYEEANAAVHNPPDDFGLSDREVPDGNQNEFGHWKALGSRPNTSSFIMLSGSSTGYECAPKGAYGSQGYEECDHTGNGDYDCNMKTNYYSCE